VAECPHPPRPDTCPDGSAMPKGGVAECPHPPSPDTCPDGSPMPKGGVAECIPQPKSPPTHEAEPLPTSDNCENQISANANVDICAEPGTMDAQDIEHNIGSGSNSGGGEHNGGEISGISSQVTETIPSGLGEMIPSLGQFSGSGPLP
ncbi:MAG: hypothetical protein WBQ25_06910, partial [Nitrososphaeraceae archaeon]